MCMLMQRPKCIWVYAYEDKLFMQTCLSKHIVVFKDIYVNSYTQIHKEEFQCMGTGTHIDV